VVALDIQLTFDTDRTRCAGLDYLHSCWITMNSIEHFDVKFLCGLLYGGLITCYVVGHAKPSLATVSSLYV